MTNKKFINGAVQKAVWLPIEDVAYLKEQRICFSAFVRQAIRAMQSKKFDYVHE